MGKSKRKALPMESSKVQEDDKLKSEDAQVHTILPNGIRGNFPRAFEDHLPLLDPSLIVDMHFQTSEPEKESPEPAASTPETAEQGADPAEGAGTTDGDIVPAENTLNEDSGMLLSRFPPYLCHCSC